MNKRKVIEWIESLENQAKESDRFFIERNELYQEKQKLIKYLEDKIKEEKKIQKFLYEKENTKLVEKATTNSAIRTYRDLLERIKNNNYEN